MSRINTLEELTLYNKIFEKNIPKGYVLVGINNNVMDLRRMV